MTIGRVEILSLLIAAIALSRKISDRFQSPELLSLCNNPAISDNIRVAFLGIILAEIRKVFTLKSSNRQRQSCLNGSLRI